jgi:purine-binding chemotaxis protein CheW
MTANIDEKTSYISLTLGTESFAVSVFKVLEIIIYEQITRIPNASEFIPGIINFRGAIVPVIDMHKRLKIPSDTVEKMVVVVEVLNGQKKVLMGLMVDAVTDVIEFEIKNIRSIPELGINYSADYLEGFVERNGKFIMVLNTDRVLDMSELTLPSASTVETEV